MYKHYVNSEYKPIKAVLLSKPHPLIHNHNNPKEVLHVKKADYKIIENEYEQIVATYKKLKIEVLLIGTDGSQTGDYLFNLMFARDLFLMTPSGAIVSRMFSPVRRDETRFAEDTLKAHSIPIKKVIGGAGTFEGADALWVNEKLVVVGVGGRTNIAGFLQVKEALKEDGIECIGLSAPRNVLHLLGSIQFVDKALVLIRGELVDPEVIQLLRDKKIKTITIHESDEVIEKHAMNIVVIAPRKIVMPAGCPKTRKIYKDSGIEIIAEVNVTQYCNAGGGLACATQIIARS